MNIFIEKKLGEVLAFTRLGADTMKKGRKGLLKIERAGNIKKMDKTFAGFEKEILRVIKKIGSEGSVIQVEKNSKKTLAKLRKMRDTYIKGRWDEEAEILEWLGFYTGASLVHWRIILGAGKSLSSPQLSSLARKAVKFYEGMFVTDERILEKIGRKSA